MSNELRN